MTPAQRFELARHAYGDASLDLYAAARAYAAAYREGGAPGELYDALELAAVRFAAARRGREESFRRLYGAPAAAECRPDLPAREAP